MNSNPYQSPSEFATLKTIQEHQPCCPVCGQTISRIRLSLPLTRCSYCGRRLCLRRSWKSSVLSTLTALVFLISAAHFEAMPGKNSLVFGIHVLLFLTFGTFWFHLFATPALAGWFGPASNVTLEKEKKRYLGEVVSDPSLTDSRKQQESNIS